MDAEVTQKMEAKANRPNTDDGNANETDTTQSEPIKNDVCDKDDEGANIQENIAVTGGDTSTSESENVKAEIKVLTPPDTTTINESHKHETDVKIDKDLDEQNQETIKQSSNREASESGQNNSVYYLKWFTWNGETLPIVTQNENGPCPLLAIMNVLTLSKKIKLPYMQEIITSQQLMEYLGDCILSSGPRDECNDELLLNYQQNMQDAIAIMHKLQTGIDVNVKFTGAKDFEYTPECVVFDLLSTGLCHGWLMDPQDNELTKAISCKSYNQLVEMIILSKEDNASEELIREGLIAEQFLERTQSQLTYHGLCELNSKIKDSELCVFFRNNHFSTLYKFKGELFLLVTDQGYLTESQVIWETLANVEGDGEFVDSSFHTIPPKLYAKTTDVPPTSDVNLAQQHQDYLVALSLQNQPQPPEMNGSVSVTNTNQTEDQDFALAMQFQNEENQRYNPTQQQQQQQQQPSHPPSLPPRRRSPRSNQNNNNCVIL